MACGWRRFLNSQLHDGEGERNAYATTPIRGPDSRFHVIWVWRETPNAATNHSLSYARSPHLIHGVTSVGRPITLDKSDAAGCTWVLRWETQGRNRAKPQVIDGE